MQEEILIKRPNTEIPYGFKLQGGADFSVPLSILQVTPNSISEQVGLRAGDAIVKINDQETYWMEHARAKMEIIRSGNDMRLTVERNAVDPSKPQHTPLSQLKTNQPVNLASYQTPPPAPRTDLTVSKSETIAIGSSHNRAPMPFNKHVGNGIDYKAAKPANWKPGDYTKWAPDNNNNNSSPQPTVTAVFHSQYNTPIGMYSDSNVFQEFQNQTKGLMPDIGGRSAAAADNNNNNSNGSSSSFQAPSTSSSFKNPTPQHAQQQQQPRGTNSLSMRMLNTGIQEVQGTSIQPPSVFDLKGGQNPFGASVPKGFRSVQAPAALPPDQRRAPMRKEFEVKHVKQSWVEPKF